MVAEKHRENSEWSLFEFKYTDTKIPTKVTI